MRWPAATVVLAACYAPTPPSGAACATGQRCPSGLSCIDGLCLEGPGGFPADARPGDAPTDADTPLGPDAALVCPPTYTRTSFGACHRVVMQPNAWIDQEHLCEQDGGHLVVIDSLTEAQSIPDPVWTGATDRIVEGTYRVVTGALLGFTYWDLGEPSAGFYDCVHVGVGKHWHAGPCDFPFGAVCEFDGRPAVPSAF
jgi:hypothetical protein